jgi:hypothetical protein
MNTYRNVFEAIEQGLRTARVGRPELPIQHLTDAELRVLAKHIACDAYEAAFEEHEVSLRFVPSGYEAPSIEEVAAQQRRLRVVA